MSKKYLEVVLEGHEKAIQGLLEGFALGTSTECHYYFSKDWGIKTETFMEAVLEWISLKAKLHHVIMNEDMFKSLEDAIKSSNNLSVTDKNTVKSSKEIKGASFTFDAVTYGKKYGEEIKKMLSNTPNGIKLENYNPKEEIQEDAKGVEMYAPDHDYVFEAKGTISGDVHAVIEFRKILDDYPLITPDEIKIEM